ncbi:MAG: hypothetical protein Q8L29_03140 [archaeon]|nr:hypothetical protein [archaeon]
MVVTPQQAKETLMRRNRTVLRELEKKIDAALTGGDTGRDICIDVRDVGRNINGTVLDSLLSAYRKAGWQVKYESDQRDGDFLRFSYNSRGRI